MKLTYTDIIKTERIKRLNIINSITGIKPANLIGTISKSGHPNLAIFSSVIHLGSDPPVLGFIMRPYFETPRNTFENIMETGFFTVNHVNKDFVENAHYTSAKFDREVSEFEACNLTEEYIDDFMAPFVKESKVKIGVKFEDAQTIKINGTTLMVGIIQLVILPDNALCGEGYLDLEKLNNTGISGLNTYYDFSKIGNFPYARPDEVPQF